MPAALDTSSFACEIGLPDSSVSIKASSSSSASIRAATRRSSEARSAPEISRPITGAEGPVRCSHGRIDVGLAGAVVTGDTDIMSRAVAQYLFASAADFAAVNDVGPDVGGNAWSGRCS